MPMTAPTVHNPALMLDWMRFSSDSCVAFIRMQADLLHQLTPGKPVTTNLRSLSRHFDHFDMADALDFVALDSFATVKSAFAEHACEFDMMRSLKKGGVQAPGGGEGFWVIEQKAGNVNWRDVNSLLRPGVVRLFTYQAVSRGADGILYFFWRQPRIGPEKSRRLPNFPVRKKGRPARFRHGQFCRIPPDCVRMRLRKHKPA